MTKIVSIQMHGDLLIAIVTARLSSEIMCNLEFVVSNSSSKCNFGALKQPSAPLSHFLLPSNGTSAFMSLSVHDQKQRVLCRNAFEYYS